MNAPRTLQEAILYFADPDRCLKFMVDIRWPDGVKCPTCGSKEVYFLESRRVWKCKAKHAKQQFSAKVGTVFEDSPIGLDKWFAAVWMVANCKNGVSSYEIHRALKVTQKTAWFMDHRIRLAMQTGSFEKVSGEFEVDESFIGGLARNMHKNKKAKITGTGGAGKAIVMGLLDRKTKKIRLRHVANTQRETLQGVVREYIEGGSYVFSDAWVAYNGLDREYIHQVIDHAETYVNGNVHTNGIENFWSLLKRGLKGTYISVEPFHLFRYLDEQAFRFNERKQNDGGRFVSAMQGITGKRVTYEKLTGKTEEVVA
ncbi:IS1595 family transposase [Candidatus Binatus sp.]|uniref:IS1595 family transposase n=1 Tax=Candidatus Binatus sp. TaxID=2811406 RepID=UPI003C69C14A